MTLKKQIIEISKRLQVTLEIQVTQKNLRNLISLAINLVGICVH